VDERAILDGLNPEQRRAAGAVRGPVCILAGAGSGKTTTITRRIAWQVASGALRSDEILAVTFTDKAAGEMRARLRRLGVDGVEARTFHSAALAQLRRAKGDAPGRILATKALLLRQIGNTLPPPYRFRPAGDLATEVEWAKNRRLTPQAYRNGLNGHEPPIPDDLMVTVFREYERRKEASGLIDFEDLLGLAVRMYEEDEWALAAMRERYAAFTVDEYQDVNLLQQSLLELWLGGRNDLCAVGDDYQSIYGFTGASPEWLLGLATRFPQATVVRLEENYRSSPQVLSLANRLVPKLGGAQKTLRASRPEGPEPELRAFDSPEDEGAFVLERVRALWAQGVPYEEMAVLMRLNARSVDFEELFADAKIPFQGAALLSRDAARQLLKGLRGAGFGSLAEEVRRVARQQGLVEPVPDGLGERELVRQADLARLCTLAEDFDDGTRTVEQWVEWLRARFDHGADNGSAGRAGKASLGVASERPSGVHLLTLHRAKGLEFDAVFLPRVEEKELPCKPAMRVPAQLAEERRLLYVGITRAKRHVVVTWAGKPSRFLLELGVKAAQPPAARKARAEEPDDPTYQALKRWRLQRARSDEIPAYVVFHNSTLAEIAARQPKTIAELASVPGVGPAKLERYGQDLLAALAAA
jgi:DNA helicase II / ATP-dependent DNA helicase PcrA